MSGWSWAKAILGMAQTEWWNGGSTTRPGTHDVVIAPDGRYAFITNEASGANSSARDSVKPRIANLEAH